LTDISDVLTASVITAMSKPRAGKLLVVLDPDEASSKNL
jgi:hypothetical protein